ncbi:hypothetical protein JTB14_025773 [Gonioctena quinquepunctata]|nr:hypothetical protein JTB14_025773 [Gonioctena quinquepunctata]
MAKVVMIPKGPPVDTEHKVRLISLLDDSGKLFRLEENLERIAGVSPRQFGFRAGTYLGSGNPNRCQEMAPYNTEPSGVGCR